MFRMALQISYIGVYMVPLAVILPPANLACCVVKCHAEHIPMTLFMVPKVFVFHIFQ